MKFLRSCLGRSKKPLLLLSDLLGVGGGTWSREKDDRLIRCAVCIALSGVSSDAIGFPLSLNDPFISPFEMGDADVVDPLLSGTRPRGLGDRDFDFLLGMCDWFAGVATLSKSSSNES
jgi:hypothetical protein